MNQNLLCKVGRGVGNEHISRPIEWEAIPAIQPDQPRRLEQNIKVPQLLCVHVGHFHSDVWCAIASIFAARERRQKLRIEPTGVPAKFVSGHWRPVVSYESFLKIRRD